MRFRTYYISFFFFLLPVLDTQGGVCGSCDCCRSEYNTKYKKGNTFKEVGLDIYLFIRFSEYSGKKDFLEKYKILYTYKLDWNEKNNINNENNINAIEKELEDEKQEIKKNTKIEEDIFKEAMEEKLTDNEEFFLNRFFSGKTNVLNFSNHHQEWRVHVYKLTEPTTDHNTGWEISDANLNDIFRKMGTTGGNNFDVAKCQDMPRWFESLRSKNRHNKNLLIVEETNNKILNDVLKKFKWMISFSYCPEMGFVYEEDTDKSTDSNNTEFIEKKNDINLKNNFEENFEKFKEDFYKNVNEIDRKVTNELENQGMFYSENELLAENKENIINNNIPNNENIIKTSLESNNIVQKEDKNISKIPAKKPSDASLGKLLKNDVFDRDRVDIIPYKKTEKNVWKKNIIDFIRKECDFHNNLGAQGFDPNRIYVMFVGNKRVGKTTMVNLLANGRIGKSANDVTSVTGKKIIYDIPESSLSVIDTAGFEKGADFADELFKWLKEPAVDRNGNPLEGKRNGDMINCFVYVIRPDKKTSDPEKWGPLSGPFFSKEDEKLFEFIIEFKKPSIFCFNSDDTVTKAVMGTRKMFGDLVFWNLSKVNTWIGNLKGKPENSVQLCQNIAHNFFDEKVAHFTIVKLVEDKKNDLKPFGLGRLLKLIIKVCEKNSENQKNLIEDMKENYFKNTIKYFYDKGFINDFDSTVEKQRHPFLFKAKREIDPFKDGDEDDLFPLLDSNLRSLYELCKKNLEEKLDFAFEEVGDVEKDKLTNFVAKFGVSYMYKNVLINNFALGNKTLMTPVEVWGYTFDFCADFQSFCEEHEKGNYWTLLGLNVDNNDQLASRALLNPFNLFWVKNESVDAFGIGM